MISELLLTGAAVVVLVCPAAGVAPIRAIEAIQADSKQTPARESRCRGMAKPPPGKREPNTCCECGGHCSTRLMASGRRPHDAA